MRSKSALSKIRLHIAWCLIMALLATFLPAGALSGNLSAKAAYPPSWGKTWTVTHDDDGSYIQSLPKNVDGYLVMPGETVTFDVFEKDTLQEISGTNKKCAVKLKTAGMVISDIYDFTPGATPRFTASGQISENTAQISYKPGEEKNETFYLTKGYTSFTNNTENYAAFLTDRGDYQTISGNTYDAEGAMISQTQIKTLRYKAYWYPAKWTINWDIHRHEDVTDITFQGAKSPAETCPVWYNENEAYQVVVNDPVSAGRHFTCWEAEPNLGFGNPTEARVAGDNGMSTTTLSFTPGRYAITEPGVSQFTVYPNFEDNYTITYHAEGGTILGQKNWIYEAYWDVNTFSKAGLETAPVRSGYTFDGWYYIDEEGAHQPFTNLNTTKCRPNWEGDASNVSKSELNLDVYASWKEAPKDTPTVTPPKKEKTEKAANTITLKTKQLTLQKTKTDKKKVNVKLSKVITVKNAKGKVTYRLVSVQKGKSKKAAFKKLFKVNSSSKKITVQKKIPKGVYTLKIEVKAAGNEKYKSKILKKNIKIAIR